MRVQQPELMTPVIIVLSDVLCCFVLSFFTAHAHAYFHFYLSYIYNTCALSKTFLLDFTRDHGEWLEQHNEHIYGIYKWMRLLHPLLSDSYCCKIHVFLRIGFGEKILNHYTRVSSWYRDFKMNKESWTFFVSLWTRLYSLNRIW